MPPDYWSDPTKYPIKNLRWVKKGFGIVLIENPPQDTKEEAEPQRGLAKVLPFPGPGKRS